MRRRHHPTTLARYAARTVVAAVAAFAAAGVLTGCDSPGPLHDAGPARPVAVHASPLPLWPSAATSAPATPRASVDQPSPPSPLTGITVPAGGLRQLDAPTVLAHDPALTDLERRVLNGGCPDCRIQPGQYRDLSGDGRPELITAVVTHDPKTDPEFDQGRAVVHVYTDRDGAILPVLSLTALAGFTADTVGRDLVVHEPTAPLAATSSTYRWNSVRMAFVDRQITYTGPADGAPGCPPAGADLASRSTPGASPVPGRSAVVPSPAAAAPTAPTVRPTRRP